MAFSPDGRTILTGSEDYTARLWDTDYRDWIAYACARVSRDFTVNERQQFRIPDLEPTCPQFTASGNPTPIMPPTTTSLAVTLPILPLVASPTPSLTLHSWRTTATGPGILLTFMPSATITLGSTLDAK